MNAVSILLYGTLVFTATFVVSVPFGFIEGFAKARGKSLSARILTQFKWSEYALEMAAVTLVIAILRLREPANAILNGLAAILIATAISFLLEVRLLRSSAKELVIRMLIGLLACLPLGIYFGANFASV